MTCTRDSCTDESVSTIGDCKIGLRQMVSGSGSEPYMLSTSNDWASDKGLEIGLESMVGEGWAVWLTMYIGCWQGDEVSARSP